MHEIYFYNNYLFIYYNCTLIYKCTINNYDIMNNWWYNDDTIDNYNNYELWLSIVYN